MQQVPNTLREILTERAGRARALDPDDVMETIAEYLAAHPEGIEELAPGMRLTPKPISKRERAKRMSEASSRQRELRAQQRYKVIVPIIKSAMKDNPEITLRELARVLDEKGVKPQRSERWSAASVQFVINKTGILNESTQA